MNYSNDCYNFTNVKLRSLLQLSDQGSARFKIWFVIGYHWLPEFSSQGGYRLSLVTRILVSGWLSVTTGNHNFGLRVVTGYRWLPEFWSQGDYHRLPTLHSSFGYRLPSLTTLSHLNRLPAATNNSKFFW